MSWPDAVHKVDPEVVSQYRKTRRYATIILDGAWLEHFRADLVWSPEYSPA
jgi:hypothetical protein